MSNKSGRPQSARYWFSNLAASSRPPFSKPWSLIRTSSTAPSKPPNPPQSQPTTQTKAPSPSRSSSTTQPKETTPKPSRNEPSSPSPSSSPSSSPSPSPSPTSLHTSPKTQSKTPTSSQPPSTTQAKASSPSRSSLITQPKVTTQKPSQIAASSPSTSLQPPLSTPSPSPSSLPSPTSPPSSSLRRPSRPQSPAQTIREQSSPPLRKLSKPSKTSPMRTPVTSRSPSPIQSTMHQQQAGTKEVPQILPQPNQLAAQSESATKKPTDQKHEYEWFPPLEPPPQVVTLQPQDQEQSLLQKATQPTVGQNQPNADLEPKQVPSQVLISERKSDEGKPIEEDPGSKQNIKLSQLPESKEPQKDTEQNDLISEGKSDEGKPIEEDPGSKKNIKLSQLPESKEPQKDTEQNDLISEGKSDEGKPIEEDPGSKQNIKLSQLPESKEPQKDTEQNDLISERKSEEVKPLEEDPDSRQNIKLSQLPENKEPQKDTEPKENLHPSQPPKIKKNHETGAALDEDIKHLILPQEEEKPQETNGQVPKSDMVVKHEINTSNQESEEMSEDDQKEMKKAAAEIQEAGKPTTIPSKEIKKNIEPELHLADHNSKPSRLHQYESEHNTEFLNSQKHIQEKSSKGMKSTSMEASSTMRASSSNSERASFQKEIKESISRLISKLNIEQSDQLGSKQATSIITLAGKNKGASMFIVHETKNKESFIPVHRGYRIDENKGGATNGNEESQKERPNLITDENAVTTSINSNVQSINNSLLHEGSCIQGDPGVHLMLSIKPKKKKIQLRGGNELIESLKSIISITPPQSFTYEPNARKCIRKLPLESTESIEETPPNLQNHRCYYRPEDLGKGKDNRWHPNI